MCASLTPSLSSASLQHACIQKKHTELQTLFNVHAHTGYEYFPPPDVIAEELMDMQRAIKQCDKLVEHLPFVFHHKTASSQTVPVSGLAGDGSVGSDALISPSLCSTAAASPAVDSGPTSMRVKMYLPLPTELALPSSVVPVILSRSGGALLSPASPVESLLLRALPPGQLQAGSSLSIRSGLAADGAVAVEVEVVQMQVNAGGQPGQPGFGEAAAAASVSAVSPVPISTRRPSISPKSVGVMPSSQRFGNISQNKYIISALQETHVSPSSPARCHDIGAVPTKGHSMGTTPRFQVGGSWSIDAKTPLLVDREAYHVDEGQRGAKSISKTKVAAKQAGVGASSRSTPRPASAAPFACLSPTSLRSTAATELMRNTTEKRIHATSKLANLYKKHGLSHFGGPYSEPRHTTESGVPSAAPRETAERETRNYCNVATELL